MWVSTSNIYVSCHSPQGSSQGNADLLLQLQNLFEKLKDHDGTTKGITKSLGIRNGEMCSVFSATWLSSVLFMLSLVLVYEQQDAVEYYQKILKSVGPEVSQVSLLS